MMPEHNNIVLLFASYRFSQIIIYQVIVQRKTHPTVSELSLMLLPIL